MKFLIKKKFFFVSLQNGKLSDDCVEEKAPPLFHDKGKLLREKYLDFLLLIFGTWYTTQMDKI